MAANHHPHARLDAPLQVQLVLLAFSPASTDQVKELELAVREGSAMSVEQTLGH